MNTHPHCARGGSSRARGRVVLLALLSVLVRYAHAGEVDPLELVPAESLLCWNSNAYPETDRAAAQPSALGTLIEAGARITGTPLRPRAKLALRVAESFSVAIRYPFALAAIDASARPSKSPDSQVVDDLRIALIIQTGGDASPFRRIIQKTANDLTDDGQAKIEKLTAGPYTYEELRDKRIDEPFAWGEIGGCFVFTYGVGVWPVIASVAEGKRESLAKVEWVSRARADSPQPRLIEIYAAMREIRRRLDPVVEQRASEFFKAWKADQIDDAAWVLGFEGRGMYCVAHFLSGGEMAKRVYAHPSMASPELLKAVPESARFAVYRFPMSTFLPRFFGGYYSTRGEKLRRAAIDVLNRIQAKHKFNVQTDILEHLGDTIVLHNDPPHPLRLPLAFTTLIPIESDAAGVRERVELLLTDWQSYLNEPEADGTPATATLDRDGDGVWSFRWGPLVGLSWTFTEKFLIISWSPTAVREYLDHAGAAVGKRLNP